MRAVFTSGGVPALRFPYNRALLRGCPGSRRAGIPVATRGATRISTVPKEGDMLDRCPTCGRTTGTLMEMNPDSPGLIEILTDERRIARRVAVTIALCVLAALAIVATEMLFR